MNTENIKKLILATVFSIAMAMLETAVVIYLRHLIYGGGFEIPLKPTQKGIMTAEIFREAATIIMLVAVGYMLAKTKLSRFAWFIYCFAIWDIFYYVFLYFLIDWPASILDWDILFLIPVVWYGPVLTPCLVAASMIGLALIIIRYEEKGALRRLRKREWGTMLIGTLVILFTFMWPYYNFAAGLAGAGSWALPDSNMLIKASAKYIPDGYNWWLYFAGLATMWAGIAVYWNRIRKANQVLY